MTVGRKYIIEQRIKLHTKPLNEIYVERVGTFIKVTKAYFIFKEFRAMKKTVLLIKEKK